MINHCHAASLRGSEPGSLSEQLACHIGLPPACRCDPLLEQLFGLFLGHANPILRCIQAMRSLYINIAFANNLQKQFPTSTFGLSMVRNREKDTRIMADMWRLFIAIELPPSVLAQLAEIQDHLKKRTPPDTVRWVNPTAST